MKVTILLPAHNEEKIIKKALNSLLRQSYYNLEIICVLDNCIDNTEKIINDNFEDDLNIKVYKSMNNKHKKAGALNQIFDIYFDKMGDYVLVMDADTVLHYRAVEEGVNFLNKYINHGAVCSTAGILSVNKKNILWYFQNIEYGFGDTNFIENFGNVFVCRGMYSMYVKSALKDIIINRRFLYDINSITEDYELTLELKKLGYSISSNSKIKAYTDVPITIKEFWVQRVRWMKGGVDDLINHGFKKHTRLDIFWALFYRLVIVLQLFFIVEVIKVKSVNIIWFIFMIIVYTINVGLRLKYIQHKDKKTYILLFTMFPMLLYGFLDMILTMYTTFLSIFKINIKWR